MSERKSITVGGFEKDAELVKNGAQVGLGKNAKGEPQGVLVKPANTAAFEDRLTALSRKYSPSTLRSDPELQREIENQVLAEKAFIGFWGLLDGDGAPIENSYENRLAMLEDRDFRADVVSACTMRETFRRAQQEDALGNSARSSSGD